MNSVVNRTSPNTDLAKKLKQVSRLVAAHDNRGVDRYMFYVELGGFDTHSDINGCLGYLFHEVNDAILVFSNQLKSIDVWYNVTTIQVSDFARTLIPNSSRYSIDVDHFICGGAPYKFIFSSQI